MENAKESNAGDKPSDAGSGAASVTADENSNATSPSEAGQAPSMPDLPLPSRTPFTSLSQVDADLALARALQEQERAYMMIRNGGVESDYESSDDGSYEFDEEEGGEELVAGEEGVDLDHPIQEVDDEEEEGGSIEGSDYGEDAFDANDLDIDPADFENDEAFARALQDAEEREVAARLMALTGLNDWVGEDDNGDHGSNSQDAWQEVDPDEYSYEELIALGEIVGTENRGLSADTIASLTSVKYKAENIQDGNTDQCVICRLEYEDGESLVALACKHMYHSECINKWLQINKVCPVCNTEVSTSGNNQS